MESNDLQKQLDEKIKEYKLLQTRHSKLQQKYVIIFKQTQALKKTNNILIEKFKHIFQEQNITIQKLIQDQLLQKLHSKNQSQNNILKQQINKLQAQIKDQSNSLTIKQQRAKQIIKQLSELKTKQLILEMKSVEVNNDRRVQDWKNRAQLQKYIVQFNKTYYRQSEKCEYSTQTQYNQEQIKQINQYIQVNQIKEIDMQRNQQKNDEDKQQDNQLKVIIDKLKYIKNIFFKYQIYLNSLEYQKAQFLSKVLMEVLQFSQIQYLQLQQSSKSFWKIIKKIIHL